VTRDVRAPVRPTASSRVEALFYSRGILGKSLKKPARQQQVPSGRVVRISRCLLEPTGVSGHFCV